MAGYGESLYGVGEYGETTSPFLPSALCVEMFYDGAWNNVTGDVRADTVVVTRGRGPESDTASPGTATFTLDNISGAYSPRNPNSPLYGLLGRAVPARVGLGSPTLGTAQTGSGGTSITAPALDVVDTAGTLVWWAAVSPPGNVTGPGTYGGDSESDGNDATFSVAEAAFVVDGAYPAASGTHSTTITGYAAMQVALGGTWSYDSGNLATGGDASVLNVTTSTDGNWACVFTAWSADPAGLMGPPIVRGGGHVEFLLVADSGPSTGPRVQAWWGYFPDGAYELVTLGDNAGGDCRSIFYKSSDCSQYKPLFAGAIRDWPLEWDVSNNEVRCPVTVNGGVYRLQQDKSVVSQLRAISAARATHYWPLEDTGGSDGFDAVTAGTPRLKLVGASEEPVWAVDESFPGSSRLATWTDVGASAVLSGWDNSRGMTAGLVIRVPASGAGVGANIFVCQFVGGNVSTVGVEYTSNTTGTFKVTYNDGTATYSPTFTFAGAFPSGWDGQNVALQVKLRDNGTDLDFSIYTANVTWNDGWTGAESVAAATLATTNIGTLQSVLVGVEVGTGATLLANAPGIGHFAVTEGDDNFPAYMLAYGAVGLSQAGAGVRSALASQPVPTVSHRLEFTSGTVYDNGPVAPGSAYQRVIAAEVEDQAIFADAPGFDGVEYIARECYESRSPMLTFDYEANQVTPPMVAADDDFTTANQVTVNRPAEWGSATSTVRDGDLGTDAVGVYARDVSAFPNTATLTQSLADWLSHLGTTNEQRFPSIPFELSLLSNEVNLALLPELCVGSTIRVENLPAFVQPGWVDLIVIGVSHWVGTHRFVTTVYTTPAAGWRAAYVDDATFGRVADSGDIVLNEPLDTTEFVIDYLPLDSLNAVDEPYDVLIDGERFTVTGVGSNQFASVRSVNGVVKTHASGALITIADPVFVAY